MRKVIFLLLIAILIGTTSGCANGPIRRLFQGNDCNTCNAPASEPGFGFGYSGDDDCVTCSHGGSATPSYVDNGYSDPYVQGSNYGGASINPPVFDGFGSSPAGSTTGSPQSNGTLPDPGSNPGGGF
jgi:hypothetical protein